ALQSLAVRRDKWSPPIVKSVATEGQGIEELAGAICEYQDYMRNNNLLARKRTRNWETRLVEMLRDRLLEKARTALSNGDLSRFAVEIAEHKRDPYSLIEAIASGLGKTQQ